MTMGCSATKEASGTKDSKPTGPAKSKFFAIHHTFKEGKAEAWWKKITELVSDEAKFQNHRRTVTEAGFFDHAFMPASTEGPILCVWESKEGCTVADMQAFIDSDKSPAGTDTFVNVVYPCMDGGMPPASAFPAMPAPPKPTTGSMFWVQHEFLEGGADKFWPAMASFDMAAATAKYNGLGFHNHYFIPSAMEGPVFCVWESKEPMAVEQFQVFIDGPDGPAPGVFKNTVRLAQPGSMCPSAKFTLPDMLMGAKLNDFADWFAGFKTHADCKTFPMNGETYTASMARGEACDEAKTDVLVDNADPNSVVIQLMSMDMGKMGPVMEEPDFKKMMSKAIADMPPPLVMTDPPPPGAPGPEKMDLFFTYEVEDVDLWVEGFLAHGTSKTGTWGVEAKYARGDFCDEAKTRVFKSAYNSKRVGGMIYGCDMKKMGEFMADPSFEAIGKALKFKPETMMIKSITPAPMPEAPIPAAAA